MATIKKPFKIFNKAANTWNKYHLETDSTQVTHTKADGTDTTVAEQILALNSTLKWSDWISLGQNALGVWLLYRYNAYEVELSYRGNLKAGMSIGGGSVGYQWPGFPTDLKPPYNFEAPIYSVVGDNPKLSLRFFPDNGTITITSHTTSKTSEEYISGFYRYTRR